MQIKNTVVSESNFTRIKGDYQVDSGATFISVKEIKELLPKIGEVTRVVHYRNPDTGRYVTYVLGTRGAIREKDGLSSGFGGTGPKGLQEVLVACGFDKDKVWEEITKKETRVTMLEFIH